MYRKLFAVVVVALLIAACSSDDTADDPATDSDSAATNMASSDLGELQAQYPLSADFAVDSVVWHRHDGSNDTFLDSIAPPAQDNNPIVEAVFQFDDEPELQALLDTGRAATVATVPAWYPSEIVALSGDGDIPVLVSRSVDGLPGIVYTFTQASDYVVVIYDETIDG